jgi:Glycosyltransferase family 87
LFASSAIMRAPLRKKMWIGTAGVALFVSLLAAYCIAASAHDGKKRSVGLDFIAFYTAGTLVHEGKIPALYDIPACQHFQHDLAAGFGIDLGSAVGPWWNPPFYAWVFVPLARLSYSSALRVWLAIDVIAAAAACWLMVRMLPLRTSWKNWTLVPVLVGLSMPFLQCMTHAQNSATSLLILAAAVAAWRSGRGILAGLTMGLLFYKPQLGAVLAIVLIVDLGWRALLGLGITGSALLAINLFTLPGSLADYLHRLPANVRFVQTQVPYMWDRHVTIKAFWRLAFQGRDVGPATGMVTALTLLCCAALAAYLLTAIWKYTRTASADSFLYSRGRKPRSPAFSTQNPGLPPPAITIARDRLIAAAIAATPLLMPFYFDYDQLLLAIPAVLFASEWLTRPTNSPVPRLDRLLLIVWPIYYCVLILNPDIAEATRFNPAVLLLATIALTNIARLAQPITESVAIPRSPATAPRSLAA